jgi:predicted dienelactone hydrolase
MGDVSKLITPEIVKKGNTKFKNLKDDRVSAFVAMAPAIGQGFQQKEQLININDPILIIGAEKDEITPIETNAKHYHKLIKNSNYIELKGNIGHYIFLNEAKSGLKRDAPLLFKDNLAINRRSEHNKVAKIIINFFDNQLK